MGFEFAVWNLPERRTGIFSKKEEVAATNNASERHLRSAVIAR